MGGEGLSVPGGQSVGEHLTWLLVLAHVVGDFVLQTDWVFRMKVSHRWGVLLHVGLCGAVMVVVLLPFSPHGWIWMLIGSLTAWHLFLDWGKGKLRGQRGGETIGLFLGDQVLHIVGIVGAVWACCRLGGPPTVVDSLRWMLVARQSALVATAVLGASFAGAPFIYLLQRAGRPPQCVDPPPFPSYMERVPGYVERALGAAGAYFGGWALVALLPIGFRWAWRRGLRNSTATIEAITGIALCLVMGLGARLLVGR